MMKNHNSQSFSCVDGSPVYQHGSKPTFKLKQHIYILTNRNITHLLKCICFTNIWDESILKNLLIIRVNMNHSWRLMLGLDIKISSHANSTISKMVFSFPNSIYLSWWCWWKYIILYLLWCIWPDLWTTSLLTELMDCNSHGYTLRSTSFKWGVSEELRNSINILMELIPQCLYIL